MFHSRFLKAAAAGVAFSLAAGAALAEDMTFALSANVVTLDPHLTTTVGTDLSVISHIYTPLVIRQPDMKIYPAAAKSWEVTDGLTWTFHLRDDLTFPDGSKLDAAAVKWNIERILNPETKSPVRAWLTTIKEIKVVDPVTVQFVTDKPFASLPDQMSQIFIMSPEWTQSHNPAIEASGTGPYDLVSYVSGDSVTLKAKAGHVDGAPSFDNVGFRVIPEDSSRIAALLAGEVDLIAGIPPFELERINGTEGVSASSESSIRMVYVKFNNLKPPFAGNTKLKLALNYAIDKEALRDAIWDGQGELSRCQPLNPAYFGYNPDLAPFPYDPEKAKSLLAEAGFAEGLTLEFEVPMGRYLLASEMAQAIAAQWAEIGVNTNIVEMEYGRWLDKYQNAGQMGDLSYIGQSWPTLTADGMLGLLEPGNIYAYYDNEEFGNLIREARSLTDNDQRLALYKKATESFCASPAHLVLFDQPTTYALRDRIKWQARADDIFRAMDISVAK